MDADDRGAHGLTDPPIDGKPSSDSVRTDSTGRAGDISDPRAGVPDASIGVVIGSRMGPYTIHSLLGRGGMGEVYRASDEQLGRDVAIKILHSVRLIDPQQRLRFDREARTLAALNHPRSSGFLICASSTFVARANCRSSRFENRLPDR